MNENVHQWRSYRVSQTGGNGGGMDNLTRRVEHLEQDTHQIKVDLAILTTRSESFATKADVESVRTEVQGVRAEVIQELAASEARTNARFDASNTRFDAINTKFDNINTKFDTINTKFDTIDARPPFSSDIGIYLSGCHLSA